MNVLFLTITRITDIGQSGIYTDLMKDFRDNGHQVYIVSPTERRYKQKTSLNVQNGVSILNVRSFNIQKTNLIEKGIGTLLLESQFSNAIKKYFSNVKFDLILYSTPPITFSGIIRNLKLRDGALSYLLLKDIFPQNAVDLGMIKNQSALHNFFLKKERALYASSDFIGCMSPANAKYIIRHNPQLNAEKVEVNPNSIRLSGYNKLTSQNFMRDKFSIPKNSIVFVYGGNLGKPQGLDFLIDILHSNLNNKKAFFLIIGTGTEYQRLENWFSLHRPLNASLISALPKEEYDELLQSCDVGLIFLDKRFTIPNFPSRILSYMEYKIPILAATDTNTDVGSIIENNEFGYWCENGDLSKFNELVNHLISQDSKIKTLGLNGYNYLLNNYLSKYSYEKIIQHFKDV